MPEDIKSAILEVRKCVKVVLGIHCHNDSDTAVAGTLSAVKAGAALVQGTMNGYGERCGNANLCSVIPALELKMGLRAIGPDKLKDLRSASRYVDEIANLAHRDNSPYVGDSAFAHKGGMHVDAVKKDPASFEHVEPNRVGNRRRILVSELSGVGNILLKTNELGLNLKKDDPKTREILNKVKEMESVGYMYEGAEASLELLIRKTMKTHRKFFDLEGFRVIVENRGGRLVSEATIKIKVGGVFEHTAAEGDGPVDALSNALRKSLDDFYPQLKNVRLKDFKVRVLDAKSGTQAKVRVIIESGDGSDTWGTVGVSENIIEASWDALVDGIEYKLMKGGAQC